MLIEDLRQQIVTTVEATKDETLLQDIADILSQRSDEKTETYYRKRLEESVQQAENGQLLPDDAVHQMARQWITK